MCIGDHEGYHGCQGIMVVRTVIDVWGVKVVRGVIVVRNGMVVWDIIFS
jgi:hypothetical protein